MALYEGSTEYCDIVRDERYAKYIKLDIHSYHSKYGVRRYSVYQYSRALPGTLVVVVVESRSQDPLCQSIYLKRQENGLLHKWVRA